MSLDTELRRSENLQIALSSREVIGQAEGILIERERFTPEEAFTVLRRASQNLNLRLRDLAQHVVDTGDVPKREKP
jgi:AmiR/NasT family two-component response regulator